MATGTIYSNGTVVALDASHSANGSQSTKWSWQYRDESTKRSAAVVSSGDSAGEVFGGETTLACQRGCAALGCTRGSCARLDQDPCFDSQESNCESGPPAWNTNSNDSLSTHDDGAYANTLWSSCCCIGTYTQSHIPLLHNTVSDLRGGSSPVVLGGCARWSTGNDDGSWQELLAYNLLRSSWPIGRCWA